MAHEQYDGESVGNQGARRPRRAGRRRCLLKGCECWFQPSQVQQKYCSEGCRREAKRWRNWRASERWRSSERGKECRRDQSRRYRERQCQRAEEKAKAEAVAAGETQAEVEEQLTFLQVEVEREGQRAATNLGITSCSRPGCYELFVITSRSPLQKYCSCNCRQALRRVRQRKACWHRRRVSRRTACGRGPP